MTAACSRAPNTLLSYNLLFNTGPIVTSINKVGAIIAGPYSFHY